MAGTQYDSRGRRTREDRVLTVSGTGDGIHLGAPLPTAAPTTSTYPADLSRLAREATPPLGDPAQGGGDGLITVRYQYDLAGRLVALIDDNGNETDWQYDCLGRKIAETKGIAGWAASGSINLADVQTAPTTIQWTYDATTGYLNSMTREDGSVLTYTYDSRDAGRLVSVSVTSLPSEDNPPLAGTTAQTFTYDGPGHRLASTDNNDPATAADDADCAWLYDSLGRTIEESQQLGATGSPAVVSYQYTANDRAALVYPNGRMVDQTYHYPGGPLRTILDDGAPSAIAQYDYLGGRTLVRAMQNGVNLDLRDGGGAAFFDATGRPTKWLHRDTNQSGGPTKIGFEYAYDGNGNKLYQKSVHDPLDSQRYAYDSADRLTACVRGPFGALPEGFCGPSTGTWPGMDQYEGWNLDGLGNWSEYTTRKAGPTTATATTVETRTDDTFNAYADIVGQASSLSPTHTPQTHDPNGNLTNDGKKVLKWDAMNRLREVWTTTGTLVATYVYDTDGRRLRKTVQPGFPGESGVFAFADWRMVEDRNASGTLALRQYTYGNYLDEVLTMDTDLTTNGLCTEPADRRLFYHQNSLFSVYALTDHSGNVVEGDEYDPYGKHTLILDGGDADAVVNFDATDARHQADSPSATSRFGNSRAFTGKPYDYETELVWLNRRYLDASDGRFISRDTALEATGPVWDSVASLLANDRLSPWDPLVKTAYGDGPNLLSYTRDSPTNFGDPLGLFSIDSSCKGQIDPKAMTDAVETLRTTTLTLPKKEMKCMAKAIQNMTVRCDTKGEGLCKNEKVKAHTETPLLWWNSTTLCMGNCKAKGCGSQDLAHILLHEFAHTCGLPNEDLWPPSTKEDVTGQCPKAPWDEKSGLPGIPYDKSQKDQFPCTGN